MLHFIYWRPFGPKSSFNLHVPPQFGHDPPKTARVPHKFHIYTKLLISHSPPNSVDPQLFQFPKAHLHSLAGLEEGGLGGVHARRARGDEPIHDGRP